MHLQPKIDYTSKWIEKESFDKTFSNKYKLRLTQMASMYLHENNQNLHSHASCLAYSKSEERNLEFVNVPLQEYSVSMMLAKILFFSQTSPFCSFSIEQMLLSKLRWFRKKLVFKMCGLHDDIATEIFYYF